MKKSNLKKLLLTGIFAAIAVIGSTISFPVLGSKCAPAQHFINIVSAIILGPTYSLGQALIASTIRNMTGLGTLFAFPGSIPGALLAGCLYKKYRYRMGAYLGEIFGTGIIGGILSYPVAKWIMGSDTAALFTFVVPFLISTGGGSILAIIIIETMEKTHLLERIQKSLE